jgi:palmitoyltransferase
MFCSRAVFRCFKTLERWGDRLTGAAGPVFVALAILLISTGIICFFEVIMPTLSYPILSLPICLLIAFNLGMHYYYVCTVSPGFTDQPSAIPGHGLMWAKPKNEQALTTGSYPEQTSVRVTLAKLSQCRKCMQMRPEVSSL